MINTSNIPIFQLLLDSNANVTNLVSSKYTNVYKLFTQNYNDCTLKLSEKVIDNMWMAIEIIKKLQGLINKDQTFHDVIKGYVSDIINLESKNL